MELVDTHCHIQSSDGLLATDTHTQKLWQKAGNPSGDELIRAAQVAGVTRLICVGCDLDDSRAAVNFVKNRQTCWASIGIHPHEAQHYADNQTKLHDFTALAKQPKVIAVGECGLDFYYNHSPKTVQIDVLRFQLELALQHDLPLIFHVREAFEEFWPIFDSYQGVRGVLHSFTDSQENADKAITRGLHIGVNGIATFTKDSQQLSVYRTVPLEKLLLETDAPFLTPAPYRGSINEPKRVGTIADFLAELRGDSRETLAAVTTRNARKLFGI